MTPLRPALLPSEHPFRGRVVLCDESAGLCDGHAQTLGEALDREAVQPGAGISQ